MVVVALPEYGVIERMVEHLHAHLLEKREVIVVARQQADVVVGRDELDDAGLCRIDRLQGLGHILDRVWVFEFVPQHDKVVIDADSAVKHIRINVKGITRTG